jgi:hypothetical protein
MSSSRDFKNNRSNAYQWVILESPAPPEQILEYSDSHGFCGLASSGEYQEQLYELQEQLKAELWRIIETELTERQKQVLKLLAEGKTQMDIAKMLSVNQSSVTKSVNGNTDYRNGKKTYGGAKKKIQKIAAKDPKVQEILKKIEDLQEDF